MNNMNVCKFNPVQSSDLNCSGFVYEQNNCQSRTCRSDKYALHLVSEGEGRFECEGKVYEIATGALFFVEKNETFSVSGEGLKYYYIRFDGRRGKELLSRIGVNRENRVYRDHGVLIAFWKECLSASNETNLDLLAESVLLYSLARLSTKKDVKSDMVSRVIALASEGFTDPALSLSSVSEEIGYHEKYVSAKFKKEVGMPFVQYLRNIRIDHAVFLMEQGVVSVKNIAILSGFSDSLYFSKVFKEMKGISPKEFINKKEAIICQHQ